MILMEDRQLLTVNENEIIQDAQRFAEKSVKPCALQGRGEMTEKLKCALIYDFDGTRQKVTVRSTG